MTESNEGDKVFDTRTSRAIARGSHVGYRYHDGIFISLEILGDHNSHHDHLREYKDFHFTNEARIIEIYDKAGNIYESIEVGKYHCLNNAQLWLYNHDRKSKTSKKVYKESSVVKGDVCNGLIIYNVTEELAKAYFEVINLDRLMSQIVEHEPPKIEDGEHIDWFSDENKRALCTYRDGLKHGKCEHWFPNGQMKVRCSYKKGELSGLYEEWDKHGQMLERCEYLEDVDLVTDVEVSGVEIEKRFYRTKFGIDYIIEHTVKTNETGIKKRKRIVRIGRKNGLLEKWYPNGVLQMRGNYSVDRLDGLLEKWDENGKLKFRRMHVNGERTDVGALHLQERRDR